MAIPLFRWQTASHKDVKVTIGCSGISVPFSLAATSIIHDMQIKQHKKIRFLAVLLILSVGLHAQAQNITKQKWHFDDPLTQDTLYGYTQTVKVDNVLYISGTVLGTLTPKGITRLYEVLGKSLASFGASFQNVVKENLYTTDMEELKKCIDFRKPFYKGDYPAATWVQVVRLFMAEGKLEVELVAHLPK